MVRLGKYRNALVLTLSGLTLLLISCTANPLVTGVAYTTHRYQYGAAGVLLLLTGSLGLYGTSKSVAAEREPVVRSSRFFSDDPKPEEKDLTAAQKGAAKHLYEVLSGGEPRSVALTGIWGSGKTLVYRKVRTELENNEDILWVDFEPWRYRSEDALLLGFYESIASTIAAELGFSQSARSKVMAGLRQAVEPLLSKVGGQGVLQLATRKMDGSEKPEDLILWLLKRTNKRLIIVVENIERQKSKSNIFRTLQLVHHAAALCGEQVQTVMIYDKSTMMRAAPAHFGNPAELLEKFSEIEILLPPPEQDELQAFFEREVVQTLPYLKAWHIERLPHSFFKSVETHRALIRVCNQWIMSHGLAEENQQTEVVSAVLQPPVPVDDGDALLLWHIANRYPWLFRHIERNRKLYSCARKGEEDIEDMFMDDKERQERDKRVIDSLFEGKSLDAEEKETLERQLQWLFPRLKQVFGRGSERVDSVEKMREIGSVGDRDVLDAFFNYSGNRDAYLAHVRQINRLFAGIDKATSGERIARFKRYMEWARDDSSSVDSVTMLRNVIVQREDSAEAVALFRSWLHAGLETAYEVTGDEVNSALGRILSGANQVAERETSAERTKTLSSKFFHNVEAHLSDPYSALLLLLFVLPERGNSFFAPYIREKGFLPGGLYDRVLGWVDGYMSGENMRKIICWPYEKWGFILFQWGLSMSMSEVQNSRVRDATSRRRTMNRRLFAVLEQDDRQAYEFIIQRFWGTQFDSDKPGWRINAEQLGGFGVTRLKKLARQLSVSADLTSNEQEQIHAFAGALSKYDSKNGS